MTLVRDPQVRTVLWSTRFNNILPTPLLLFSLLRGGPSRAVQVSLHSDFLKCVVTQTKHNKWHIHVVELYTFTIDILNTTGLLKWEMLGKNGVTALIYWPLA